MKTNIRNFAIAISSFLAFAFSPEVKAIEDLCVAPIENSRKIRMKTTAPNTTSFGIFLMDDRNRPIYQEMVQTGDCFKKLFDFAGFKDGTYTLVSEMEHIRYNRVFEVKDNEVNLKESYYSFIPQFKIKDGRLLVHHINNDKQDIGITLTGFSGTLFNSYFDGNELIFHKAFSVEDLMDDSYTLEISAMGETYSFDFNIN
jgi:hypothetical protein